MGYWDFLDLVDEVLLEKPCPSCEPDCPKRVCTANDKDGYCMETMPCRYAEGHEGKCAPN
jgi:hypothetical protein